MNQEPKLTWTTLEDWHHEATLDDITLRVIRLDNISPPKFHWDVWRDGKCQVQWIRNTLTDAQLAAEKWAEKELSR